MLKKIIFGISIKVWIPFMLILFMAGFIPSYDKGMENNILQAYDLNKSKNPEASRAFLMMVKHSYYIEKLHKYFNYDSVVMKPFLSKMEEYYQKGKSLLPKDSVEDIFWWTLSYRSIYSMMQPHKGDFSLAWQKNLPAEKFKKVHDDIYTKLLRYSVGKVYWDTPRIKKLQIRVWLTLLDYFRLNDLYRYSSKTIKDKFDDSLRDNNLFAKVNVLLYRDMKFAGEHIQFDSNPSTKYEHYFIQLDYLLWRATRYTFNPNSRKLPKRMCSDNNSRLIVNNLIELTKYVKKNETAQSQFIAKEIFIRGNVGAVIETYVMSCENLRSQLEPIIDYIRKNYNRYRKYKL